MASSNGPQLIEGSDLDDTWAQMVDSIRRTDTGAIQNLMIHVTHPTWRVPKPLQKHEKEIISWSKELQSTKPKRLPFTHGQRILDWTSGQKGNSVEGRLDQIKDFVVPMLSRNPRTKRAIAIVRNPLLDSDLTDDPIPALISIQFQLNGDRLNATAYFRAQEMYFFWVVNMFELISMQVTICDLLRARSPETIARPGSITTFTFTGYINPVDLEQFEKTESTTLAIERFGISQMKQTDLENLLESALIEGNSKQIRKLLNILISDKQKLDRIRDINYGGLQLWQSFLEVNENRLRSEFKDLPDVLRRVLLDLVSLDIQLQREEHPEGLRKRIQSADKAMQELVNVLGQKEE